MIKILRNKDMPVTKWTGGTTKEICIYPPEASYANRHFLYRISEARTDCQKGTFTYLPGVRRELIVLKGNFRLFHGENLLCCLKEGEAYYFPGDLEISSEGQAVDFNLMMQGKCNGEIRYLKESDLCEQMQTNPEEHIIIYVVEGVLECRTDKEEWTLRSGDAIWILDNESVAIYADQYVKLCKAVITQSEM